MTKKSLNQLKKLTAAHSTPGDESEIAGILTQCWKKAGWRVTTHGGYAISAKKRAAAGRKRPRLLICAHMDSPGFTVDHPTWTIFKKKKTAQIHIVTMGSPGFDGPAIPGRIKCRNGVFSGVIRKIAAPGEPEYLFEMSAEETGKSDLCIGDRVCYESSFKVKEELIKAPFLDNRLGCWMLSHLADLKPGWNKRYEIIVGATGSEEMTGFGAQVLAAEVKANLVIVLDATYEAKEQGVLLGGGAVVTLSDNSVLLSPETRDRIMGIMERAKTPIQFEAYNYSGTDARAFPTQGRTAPVLALLLPTRGNHSPCETAHTEDLKHWEKAIKTLERFF